MRKIIQFTPIIWDSKVGYYALCNDGTLWRAGYTDNKWIEISPVPQPPKKPKKEKKK